MADKDSYSLRHQFSSEVFGMWFVIAIALSAVANHVLNPTTGRGMGYLAIAMSFGFAFGFAIQGFGAVSAMLNPAAALSQVVAGNMGAAQFFVVIAGELLGAFFGGITVWLIYMPQLNLAGRKVFRIKDLTASIAANAPFTKKGKAAAAAAAATEMADKETVESVVNPVNNLQEDDDPFLGIWATRPAVWYLPTAFFTEFIGTFIFLFLVNLLTARGQYLYQPSYGLYSNILLPFYIGFIICAMILAMGPTGFAGNPARDLGPRLAHWLLPIPKNPRIGSEWKYAWVPIIAPLMGGALAGGLIRVWVLELKGTVTPDTNPFATNALSQSSVVANANATAGGLSAISVGQSTPTPAAAIGGAISHALGVPP